MAVSRFHAALEKIAIAFVVIGIPSSIGLSIRHSIQLAKVQYTADVNEVNIAAMKIILSSQTANHIEFRQELKNFEERIDKHEKNLSAHTASRKKSNETNNK